MASPSSSPSLSSLRPWLARFSDRQVVVWGDVVADCFLHGTTTRVSREAPALVLRYESEEYRPGGAGNAAMNVASLGGQARVVGYVGDDHVGDQVLRQLQEAGVDASALLRRPGRTPVKTRVMAGGVHTVRQQILRIDNDRAWPEGAAESESLEAALDEALQDADALLISDYGLGSVSPDCFRAVLPTARERALPAVLDSRFRLVQYEGVSAATPNETEVEEALHVRLDGDRQALEAAGRTLLARLGCPGLLITRGSCGMAIFQKDQEPVHLPIHGTDEIADVTGAGDTVIATLALALAAGADLVSGARLANVAAGLVVLKHGTATVPASELEAALRAAG